MDAKSGEAILMGYALNSKAYRVFNKTSLVVEKSIHVVYDETDAAPRKVVLDDDADFEDSNNSKVEETKEKELEDSKDDPPLEDLQRKETQHDDFPKAWKNVKDHCRRPILSGYFVLFFGPWAHLRRGSNLGLGSFPFTFIY